MKGFKTGTDLIISEYGVAGMKWGTIQQRNDLAKNVRQIRNTWKMSKGGVPVSGAVRRSFMNGYAKYTILMHKAGPRLHTLGSRPSAYTSSLQKAQANKWARHESKVNEYGTPGMKWGMSQGKHKMADWRSPKGSAPRKVKRYPNLAQLRRMGKSAERQWGGGR